MSVKNKKKLTIFSAMLFVLSGCVQIVNGEPTGWVWHLLGKPMEMIILWFANLFGNGVGSYGLGIIMVTIIVRLLITPINLDMTKIQTENSEKTLYIKPLLDELSQRVREADTMEAKRMLQMEQLELQRAAGIKMISARGCLPLFIQIPIFSALYFSTISSTVIRNDVFMGISLNEPHMFLAIVSAGLYFLQALLSQINMTPEQKQMNRSMLFITPVMQIMFAISVPAGATLYWVVGGVFSCLTTLYTGLVQKPKIKEAVAAYMKNNPVSLSKRQDVTPIHDVTSLKTVKRRNEGKQNR